MKNIVGILFTALASLLVVSSLSGCASEMSPQVHAGAAFQDKTLSGNKIDLLTLFRVENHYGAHTESTADDMPRRSYK